MKDLLTKLWILWDFWRSDFETWKRDVWGNDLDSHYCCDGRECGCQAASWREVLTSQRNK